MSNIDKEMGYYAFDGGMIIPYNEYYIPGKLYKHMKRNTLAILIKVQPYEEFYLHKTIGGRSKRRYEHPECMPPLTKVYTFRGTEELSTDFPGEWVLVEDE